VVFVVVNISRFIHTILRGKIDVSLDHNYYNFLRQLKFREEGRPLITVSNHRSLLDDPTLLGCIIPYLTIIQPKFARYTLCASDYCFKPEIPGLIHGLLEAGHTFPLKRGAGIDQNHLLNFARHVAAGDWCHIFPEGGIWQLDSLGGRLNANNKTLGKLKWGVGKLIAHSPKTPIVIPFFHMGIETTLPQDPNTKICYSLIPKPNHRVDVMFGRELKFDDLIEEHELKYGRLWKYQAKAPEESSLDDQLLAWKSRESDKILYHKITMRIQMELEKLNAEMDKLRDRKYGEKQN
jgi:monolysocardiolipin acyltransferase